MSYEKVFAALSDRTRLRLLALMSEQHVCVCYLVATLELSQPLVSRHLGYLRRAGLVRASRQGKWMYYGLEPHHEEAKAEATNAAISWFQGSSQAKLDSKRFASACCGSSDFPELAGVPPPIAAN